MAIAVVVTSELFSLIVVTPPPAPLSSVPQIKLPDESVCSKLVEPEQLSVAIFKPLELIKIPPPKVVVAVPETYKFVVVALVLVEFTIVRLVIVEVALLTKSPPLKVARPVAVKLPSAVVPATEMSP